MRFSGPASSDLAPCASAIAFHMKHRPWVRVAAAGRLELKKATRRRALIVGVAVPEDHLAGGTQPMMSLHPRSASGLGGAVTGAGGVRRKAASGVAGAE